MSAASTIYDGEASTICGTEMVDDMREISVEDIREGSLEYRHGRGIY
jgi:hypothetical protein